MSIAGAFVGLAKRLSRYRATVVLARTVIVPADRLIARLTRGKLVTFSLRELPALLLTTTGRRSGEPRTVPLLYLPDGETFVARCLDGESAAESLAPCERDIHVGNDLSLSYRFPKELLGDWQKLDAAIRAKAASMFRTAG